MKFPGLLMVVGLLVGTGCDRARTVIGALEKSKSTSQLPPVAPQDLVRSLSPDNLGSFCRQRGRLTIVEYYADWNGQSMQLISIFKDITTEFGGRVLVGRLDIDPHSRFATEQGVKTTPDVRFYSDGTLVDRFVGLPDINEIHDRIEAQVKKLPAPTPAQVAAAEAKAKEKPVAEPMKKGWLPPGMKRR